MIQRRPSTREWQNKRWYICIISYYAATKMSELWTDTRSSMEKFCGYNVEPKKLFTKPVHGIKCQEGGSFSRGRIESWQRHKGAFMMLLMFRNLGDGTSVCLLCDSSLSCILFCMQIVL